MESTVTVIIPTYKKSGSVTVAVYSVLTQAYPYLEVIFVDNNGVGSEH